MKRPSFAAVCNLCMLYLLLSCGRLHHNINIHVSDSEHYYTMYARFNPDATWRVEQYMNGKIGRKNNMSFTNTRIDGQLALDDQTTFYIKKYPGYLEIKLDKDKNSGEAYYRIKNFCEGIKKALAS